MALGRHQTSAIPGTREPAALHTRLAARFRDARDARTAVPVLCPLAAQELTAKSFARFIDSANFIEIWFINTVQQVCDKRLSNYTNNPAASI